MNILNQSLLAAGLLVGFAAHAPAFAEKTLSVGDPAPALSVGEWVKGESETELNKGEVYLIEFWATW